MYLCYCIFGLVSLVKGKTIICLENQQNYNSDLANSFTCGLMREHPPWWSSGVGGWGGVAVYLGIECTITFRIISEN